MRVHVTLTDEEVAAIDAARKEGVARSAWIAGAIRLRLRGLDRETAAMEALAAKGPRLAALLSEAAAPRKSCAHPKPRPQNPVLCYNCGGRMVDHA